MRPGRRSRESSRPSQRNTVRIRAIREIPIPRRERQATIIVPIPRRERQTTIITRTSTVRSRQRSSVQFNTCRPVFRTSSLLRGPDSVLSATFSHMKCQLLFEKYCERDSSNKKLDVIGPDGIMKFCEDLGVSPEDVKMLLLAYLLNARKAGYFTKEEWMTGFSALGCDSIAALKRKFRLFFDIALLRKYLKDDIFVNYVYNYSKENEKEHLNMETARRLLSLLIKEWNLYPEFDLFLKQYKYKVVTQDQWKMIFEFSKEIIDREKISTYNPEDAWPAMLDEFVEWMRNSAQAGEPTTTNSDDKE